MALVAAVKDGKVVTETASSNSLKSQKNSGGNMDKDAFLQLLVAEMQYQDPLEPTSNTEYITQFAQFSQVESLTNMQDGIDLQGAYQLVGKDVVMKTTSASTGETSYVDGRVDYVYVENGEPYLCINGSLYAYSDLDTVVDGEYLSAYEKVSDWCKELAKMPKAELITESDCEAIKKLIETYEGMTDYEKTFIATDVKKIYTDLVNAYTVLTTVSGSEEGTESGSEGETKSEE